LGLSTKAYRTPLAVQTISNNTGQKRASNEAVHIVFTINMDRVKM
jgi:hypothetical protein